MSSENLPAIGDQSFESLKQTTPHGAEYWSARELQSLLGYNHWRSFEKAITKAINSCEQSGNEPDHHFARARKMIAVGKGGKREVPDFQLSRFACYLIAQNGDPRKSEIALAQKYFAIQTRRQELSDQQAADLERLELRKQASEEFKMLSGAARQAGVQSQHFGIFHDAGYKGLYGGLGSEAIRLRKRVPAKDNLMDRMDATELAHARLEVSDIWRLEIEIGNPIHEIVTRRYALGCSVSSQRIQTSECRDDPSTNLDGIPTTHDAATDRLVAGGVGCRSEKPQPFTAPITECVQARAGRCRSAVACRLRIRSRVDVFHRAGRGADPCGAVKFDGAISIRRSGPSRRSNVLASS